MPNYKIQLWRYQRSRGFDEERICSKFFPSKINGFAHLVNMKFKSKEVLSHGKK
jgi:hypothetical protein